MEIERVAQSCCEDETLLEIYYEKTDYKGRGRYQVEPMEVKKGALWAFDPKADTIKRFSLSGIVSVVDTKIKWKVPEDHPRNEWEKKLAKGVNDERTSSPSSDE